MNILGILSGIFGGSKSGKSTAEVVTEAVDEYVYTEQEKEQDVSARYATDAEETTKLMTATGTTSTWFDSMVDGISRLQRPGWGLYFFGGFAGWWQFPDLTKLAAVAFWSTLFTIYFTALFGGRAVFKDMAGAITKILEAKK